MKYDGKVETVYCDGKLFPLKTGYSLGTLYRINRETFSTYELLNFGYCPGTKQFYYNRHINLPKELIKKIEGMEVSKNSEKLMIELGLYSYEEVGAILNNYENSLRDAERTKKRLLNLKTTLKREI